MQSEDECYLKEAGNFSAVFLDNLIYIRGGAGLSSRLDNIRIIVGTDPSSTADDALIAFNDANKLVADDYGQAYDQGDVRWDALCRGTRHSLWSVWRDVGAPTDAQPSPRVCSRRI
jgi:hypothetical protein